MVTIQNTMSHICCKLGPDTHIITSRQKRGSHDMNPLPEYIRNNSALYLLIPEHATDNPCPVDFDDTHVFIPEGTSYEIQDHVNAHVWNQKSKESSSEKYYFGFWNLFLIILILNTNFAITCENVISKGCVFEISANIQSE